MTASGPARRGVGRHRRDEETPDALELALLPLPRGVTGFWSVDDAPPPHIDLRAARAAVAPMFAGRRLAFEAEEQGTVRSFHDIIVRCGRERIRVLVHATVPWIAFAALEEPPELSLRFVRPPEGLAAPGAPFVLVARSLLDRPLDQGALVDLAPAELEQVAYWRPRRIGEVVFQHWD